MKKLFIISLFGLALAFNGGTSARAENQVRFEPDVEYLSPDRKEKCDLYEPTEVKEGQRFPGIVIIHGGGWTGGDKGAAREHNIGTNLVLNGYVCMSINYVLASKGNPTWPQNLYDCKTAVRWMRKNADRLHIDPKRIGVIGGSAGGHLTSMVALTAPEAGLDPKGPYGEYSCQVQAAVDLYGPSDLNHDYEFLTKKLAEDPKLYALASPVNYGNKNTPPILILHGTADKTVSLEQSKLFDQALTKAGVEHEFVIVEGAPHTFHLQPKQRDLRPVVIGFFDKHLKAAK